MFGGKERDRLFDFGELRLLGACPQTKNRQDHRNCNAQNHRKDVKPAFDQTGKEIGKKTRRHRLEAVRERTNRCPAQKRQRQTFKHQHTGQRHDKGRNAPIGNPVSLGGTDNRTDDQTGRDHNNRRQIPMDNHHRSKRTDKADDRSNRKIDMAADNHQQHAHCHDDNIAVLKEQVGQVDRFKHHAIGHHLEEGQNRDQRDHHAIFAHMRAQVITHRFAARSIRHCLLPYAFRIMRMIFSWLASFAASCPLISPSFIT